MTIETNGKTSEEAIKKLVELCDQQEGNYAIQMKTQNGVATIKVNGTKEYTYPIKDCEKTS